MAALNGYADVLASGVQAYITGGTLTAPTSWYVALYTAIPQADGSNLNTEFTIGVGDYARQAVNAVGGAQPSWSVPGTPATLFLVSNIGQITFATATADWGYARGALVMTTVSAQSVGDMLYGGAIVPEKQIVSGVTPVFLEGAFQITLSNT